MNIQFAVYVLLAFCPTGAQKCKCSCDCDFSQPSCDAENPLTTAPAATTTEPPTTPEPTTTTPATTTAAPVCMASLTADTANKQQFNFQSSNYAYIHYHDGNLYAMNSVTCAIDVISAVNGQHVKSITPNGMTTSCWSVNYVPYTGRFVAAGSQQLWDVDIHGSSGKNEAINFDKTGLGSEGILGIHATANEIGFVAEKAGFYSFVTQSTTYYNLQLPSGRRGVDLCDLGNDGWAVSTNQEIRFYDNAWQEQTAKRVNPGCSTHYMACTSCKEVLFICPSNKKVKVIQPGQTSATDVYTASGTVWGFAFDHPYLYVIHWNNMVEKIELK